MKRRWIPAAALGALLVSLPLLAQEARPDEEASLAQTSPLPSLPGLFALALRNDSDLSRQRYELEATQQELPKAWAKLKPQISASAAYLYQHSDNYYTDNPDYDPGNDFADPDNETRYEGRTNDAVYGVSLSQPLFSLERWRGVDVAKAQTDVAALGLSLAERDLALAVVDAYLEAYLASSKIRLLNAKREALELQSRQAQRAFELGVGDRINLLEARSRLDQTDADLVNAENELADALSNLERLTGELPVFGDFQLGRLDEVEVETALEAPEVWLEEADNNLQVRLAQEQYQLAEADVDVRRTGHYPEVNLNLSYSDRDSNDPFREARDARASVELDVPIYQGGYTSANVRQGELGMLASREALANQRRLARQEVKRRLRNVRGDFRQLESLKRSIESSRLYLEAAEKGRQLGLRDLVDVLDGRAELFDQRISFVEVVSQYLRDRAALKAAVGELDTQVLMDTMTLLERITLRSGSIRDT
ncbi:TolC family outer membrane protein [Pistricoccus aurantiacus]|uniref:TolC family outer membrane protein n=1 Tax=Pistricoccus aurantiacus TaxID=1883414 RepID=UPI00363631FB